MPAADAPLPVVVMGVSATGKSTVAAAIAEALDWPFVEGDDLHPDANVAKMEAGTPLTDADRGPWLDRVNARARALATEDAGGVITCSALKRRYRDRLREGVPSLWFLHLHAPYEVLEPRMQQREKHFMPTALLRSQFADLDPLGEDEAGTVVDVSDDLDAVTARAIASVRRRLGAA